MRAPKLRDVCWLGLIAGCSFGAPNATPPDDHRMPEASAPIEQRVEAGPLAEGYLDRVAIEARFLPEAPGLFTSDAIPLPGAASRASVWLSLAQDGSTPQVEVRAGWSNGQTGPWIPLAPVWSEAEQRILAASLDTAATTLQIRIQAAELTNLESLWWTANVPLAADVRQTALPEVPPLADSAVSQRAAWRAEQARCGQVDPMLDRVTLYRIPAPHAGEAVDLFLRAAQAFDQAGREWCDVRANYLIEAGASWAGRGERRSAYASEGDDTGRIAVALLGCDATAPEAREAQLASLLLELTRRYGFTSADQFQVGLSPACPSTSDDAWLRAALSAWLATDPFHPVIPPPPPPPPPTDGTLRGHVWDASTGDQTTGAALGGATVICDCGRMTTSDASGDWTLSVPAGMPRMTISKSGFMDGSRTVTIAVGMAQDLPLGLQPVAPPNQSVSVIDQSFLIRHFGGNDVDPLAFPETTAGFQAYLDAVGVRHFAALEYVTPNNPQVAQGCGFTILLPERAWWRKGAALGLLADVLRDLVNEPITLRNWWRPACYNAGVGGAAGGDHPEADALDLDFLSARSRADAQRYLCETYWNQDIVRPEEIAPGSGLNPRLNMSVGLGDVTIHLGLLSVNGRRFWLYDSYTALTNSGGCW